MSEATFSIKPILNELRERREDYERLAEKMEALKVIILSYAIHILAFARESVGMN